MGTIIVTGGAGFIGCNFVRHLLARTEDRVVVLDKLTYAGHLASLADVASHPRYEFVEGDIADRPLVRGVMERFRPDAIVNFAAETHVDRSIDDAAAFVRTNVLGTFELLEAIRVCLRDDPGQFAGFRFLHVSTDEVYGTLGSEGAFSEETPYAPNSPYAATKAALESATDCLRLELARWNIQLSVLIPGFVKTATFDKAKKWGEFLRNDETNPYRQLMHDLGDFADGQLENAITPAEVAEVVVAAAGARRPRARYFVPLSARVQSSVMNSMPASAPVERPATTAHTQTQIRLVMTGSLCLSLRRRSLRYRPASCPSQMLWVARPRERSDLARG